MIRIDDYNAIDVKIENNQVKLILRLRKDYNKNIQIEIPIGDEPLGDLISKLISIKAKTKIE